MEVKISNENGIDLVRIIGNLDSNTAPGLQSQIEPLFKDGMKTILDMSECEYVSSAGLRVLLMVAKTTKASGGKAVLSGLSEEVREVMEMTGFGSIFPNFDELKSAFADFGVELPRD